MNTNVGPNERLVRLALGAGIGAAALNSHGWKKTLLGGIAASGLVTGLTRYCPINAALRDSNEGMSEHDRSVRDTEIRRETQTSAAMGQLPGQTVDTTGSSR